VGQHAEALAENKRAQELDPLRVVLRADEGARLYWARRYDEAVGKLHEVLRLEPDNGYARVYLGYTYTAKGMYTQAIEEYRKQISIDGETASTQAFLGYALAQSSSRGEALAILDKLKTTKKYVSPAELSILYVGLGDREEAFESLQRAYEAHDPQMQYLCIDPHRNSLRDDPRFQDLLRRVGLPK
jgi:tetratricopeptide (TPR) repeat protein